MNDPIFNIPNYYDSYLVDEIIQQNNNIANDPMPTSTLSSTAYNNNDSYYSFLAAGGGDILNPYDFLSTAAASTLTATVPLMPSQQQIFSIQDQQFNFFEQPEITATQSPPPQFDMINSISNSNSSNSSVRSNSISSEISTVADIEHHPQPYYNDKNCLLIPVMEKYKDIEEHQSDYEELQQHEDYTASDSFFDEHISQQKEFEDNIAGNNNNSVDDDEESAGDTDDSDDSDDPDYVLHGTSGYLRRGRRPASSITSTSSSTVTTTDSEKSTTTTKTTIKKKAPRRRSKKADPNLPLPVCTNCKTSTTSLWRRDDLGNPLCNACGLFQKLHGMERPLSLKTDIIKRRNRQSSSTTKKRKRKSSLKKTSNSRRKKQE